MNKRDFYASFARKNKGINTESIYSFDFPENPELAKILKKKAKKTRSNNTIRKNKMK